jgi:hypothetical protein
MVTMKKCNICNHDVDNHTYSLEDYNTERGKERCMTSKCSVEGCKCYQQSLEKFRKDMINQKEHG